MGLVEPVEREEYAPLAGKRIVIGLTASTAVYKSIDLARKLIRMGAEVRYVVTREASRYIGDDLLEWAVGYPPYRELSGRREHLELSEWGDTLVIAPATLKTMSRIAYGLGDELLPLLALTMLGSGKRVIVVPTMNIKLYKSPQYKIVTETLVRENVLIIPPFIEEDRLKYPPLEDLAYCIEALTNRGRDLEGAKALVTAGPTYEYIDPVRVLTNPSSGLMGVLLAREIACRGGDVDLLHGPLKTTPPYMVNKISVVSTAEMAHKVGELTSVKRYDFAVFAAAPADYTVLSRSRFKISSRESPKLTIALQQTLKTVKMVDKNNRPGKLVVFTAETTQSYEELVARAREKLVDYDADIAVANNVSTGVGFSSKYIDACIVDREQHYCLGVVRKERLARVVVDKLLGKTYI